MPFPLNPSNEDLYIRYGRAYKFFAEENAWRSVEEEQVLTDSGINKASASAGDMLTWSSAENAYTLQSKSNFIFDFVEDISALPLVGNEIGQFVYVESEYSTYFWNGNGWYKIFFVDAPPVITSQLDSSYFVYFGSDPTTITLEATDDNNTPIVWSYDIISGSLEDTIITQVDNAFTITSGNIETVFEIRFRASSGYASVTTAPTTIAVTYPVYSISPLQGTDAAAVTGTLQPNGDYFLTGSVGIIDSALVASSSNITENVYAEIEYKSGMGAYLFLGFASDLLSDYNLSDNTNGLMYYNGNHYKNNGVITATGFGTWSTGNILQFGLDVSTRTMYFSIDDSATVYTFTLAPGTGNLYFTIGSGASARTVLDLTMRSPASQTYKASFQSKTGVEFTSMIWSS